jgi:hypothetical protein
MPGKRYDKLTASLMVDGLADNASWLARRPVAVARLSSGPLAVLCPDLSRRRLRDLACTPDVALPLLERQRGTYERLLATWRGQLERPARGRSAVEGAAALLRDFFGVLLLLHETYSDAIAACLNRLAPNGRGDPLVLAATPRILRWQITDAGLLPARKDIFETGGEVRQPPFDVGDDLAETGRRVADALGPISEESQRWAQHLTLVMVLKEWKFFLAKVVHRHFAETATAAMREVGLDEPVRVATIEEMLARLDGTAC